MRLEPVYLATVFLILLGTMVPITQFGNGLQTQGVISDMEDNRSLDEPVRENSLVSDSGNMVWNRTYDSDDITNPYRIIEAESGGYFVFYYFMNASTHKENAFLMRIDSNGNQSWNRSIHETVSYARNDMIETQDSGFTLICTFWNATTSNNSVFIMHLDSECNELWNRTLYLGYQEKMTTLIEASSGGYFLLGDYQVIDVVSYPISMLIRIDAYGNHIWNNTYTPYQSTSSIDFLESVTGDVILLASSENNPSGVNAWLLCVDVNGNHLWNKTFDEDLYGSPVDIEYSTSGGYLILGTIFDGLHSNISLLYLDEYGEIDRNLTYEISSDESAIDLTVSADGSMTFVGITHLGSGFDAVWFVRLNQSGYMQWSETFGDDAHYRSKTLLEIAPDVYIIGAATAEYYAETTPYDIWIAKIAKPMSGADSENQIHEIGTFFSYDLDAESVLGIDRWQANDTTNFMINSDGLVQNASILSLGIYGVEAIVYDTGDRHLSTTFSVMVVDTQPPSWKVIPSNQLAEFGVEFLYDVDAIDPSGISDWWLNDTTFTIDSIGVIRNATSLCLGDYPLRIYVNDTFGHSMNADIMIFVRDTASPSVNSPLDIWYMEGTDGNIIEWYSTDFHPYSYIIYHNGMQTRTGGWANDVVSLPVDNLEPGVHNFTIVFYDTFGNSIADCVIVTVQASSTSTTTTTTQTDLQEIVNNLYSQISALTIGLVIVGAASALSIILVVFSFKRTARLT